MQPLERIRELIQHADGLRDFIIGTAQQWSQNLSDDPADNAQLVIYRDGQPYIRLGYVLREMFTALAKAEEALEVYPQLWQTREDRIKKLIEEVKQKSLSVPNSQSALTSPHLPASISFYPIASAFPRNTLQSPADLQNSVDPVRTVYYCLCAYRDSLAFRTKAAQFSDQSSGTPELDSVIGDMVGQLSASDQSDVESILRNYRTANLLFSWGQFSNGTNTEYRYPWLFRFSNSGGRKHMSLLIEQIISDLTGDPPLSPAERGNLASILRRMEAALAEVGYTSFFDAITSEDAQHGPDSMLGNSQPINLIPGSLKGPCHPLLLAFARSKSRRGAVNLRATLGKVITSLIRCIDTTKVVIVVTDTWNSQNFLLEHFEQFAAFHRRGVHLLFFLTGEAHIGLSYIEIDFKQSP